MAKTTPWRGIAAGMAALAVLALSACDSSTAPDTRVSGMDVLSGDLQRDTVGKPLATPLAVRVVNAGGNAVAGTAVTFVVTAGGGSVSPAATQSDAQGIAQAAWTLGPAAGDTQRVEVRALDPSTGQPRTFATFRAVGVADAPASVTVVGASTRTGAPGAAVSPPLVVQVRDAHGNAAAGAVVAWTGGGSFAPAQSTADAAGMAQTVWTLPLSAAPQTATATSGAAQAGFTAQPVLAGSATATVTQGANATFAPGTSQTVEVRLTFSNGTPVAGAPVTWTITRDIGPGEPPLLNAPSALTDADGRARVSVYAQPGNSGTFTVHATLGGVGADVPLTVQGGPVVTVTLVYGTVGPIVVGSAQQVEVYARDATGAYRPDVPVNVVGIEGGGTVTSFAPFTSPYNVPGRVGTWTLSTVTAGVRTYPSLAPVVQRLHLQVDGVDAVAQLTPLPGPTAGGAAAPELVLLSLPGDTLTVYARPVDAYGNWTSYPNRVPQAPHTFTIEDPSVATVSASGMVTAVADGSTRLFVTIPYNSGTSSVVYTDTVNVLVGGFEGVRAPAADRLRPGSPASRPRASRGAAPARGRREQ